MIVADDKSPAPKPVTLHDLYEKYMKKVTDGFIEMNSDKHSYEHVIWTQGLAFDFSAPIRPNPDDATEYNQEMSLKYLHANTMTFNSFKTIMEAGGNLALSFSDLPKVQPMCDTKNVQVAYVELLPEPKQISREESTGREFASFSYYEGLEYAKIKGLKQSVTIAGLGKPGTYIVTCGDMVTEVQPTDFPNIKRTLV